MNIEINGGEFHWLESVDSTNAHAMALAESGAPGGTVVAAETQTAGRGRQGRKWVSPPGLNIYFSVILRPALIARHASLLTLMCAVEAASGIKAATGADVRLKWPNDLWVIDSKLGGILVESRMKAGSLEFAVAGVGINVNSGRGVFSSELEGIATSLLLVTGRKHIRAPILKTVAEAIIEGAHALEAGGGEEMLRLWKLMSVTLGRRVSVEAVEGAFEGEAVDLDETGRLLVRTDSGEVVPVVSGDVTLL